MIPKATLFAAAALLIPGPADAGPVRTKRAACDLVKASVVASGVFPPGRIGHCEVTPGDGSRAGFYVMSLHSNRRCDYICSTNMGWYAVQRSTGRVFEWDMAEDRPGPPLPTQR